MTLLFGPNSAGKSSIIQALHYAREVILHGNLDAHETEIGGKYVDLGGFKNFVHGRLAEGEEREVKIKIEVKGTEVKPIREWTDNINYKSYSYWLPLHENFITWLEYSRPENDGPFADDNCELSPWYVAEVDSCAIELSIVWDNKKSQPIISSYSTWINDIPVATISKGEKE